MESSRTDDVFPGARLRFRFRDAATIVDVRCVANWKPLLFIDGFLFEGLPTTFVPATHELAFDVPMREQDQAMWLRMHASHRPDYQVSLGFGFAAPPSGGSANAELRRAGASFHGGIAPRDRYALSLVCEGLVLLVGVLIGWIYKDRILKREFRDGT